MIYCQNSVIQVVVLAIVSALVGVAALFASGKDQSEQLVWSAAEGCAFLPHLFDNRFALFWLCLHGVLLLATVASMMAILITRLVMGRDIAMVPSPLRVASSSSTASTAAMQSKSTCYVKMLGGSQESVQTNETLPTGGAGGPATTVAPSSIWNSHRHWTAASVLTVTYITHHLPLLVRDFFFFPYSSGRV